MKPIKPPESASRSKTRVIFFRETEKVAAQTERRSARLGLTVSEFLRAVLRQALGYPVTVSAPKGKTCKP